MGWTHSICNHCWNEKNPDSEPIRVVTKFEEDCCFCGSKTNGIFIRHDPTELLCKHE